MALGYEGHVKLGSTYVLGTGTSVPRNRNRIEASSAYGGRKDTPANEIGIGLPRAYDWEIWDGSVNFEVTQDIFTDELKPWPFDRQSAKEVFFAMRGAGEQQFTKSFFTSISLSASDGGLCDGSMSFVALERDSYVYGDKYIDNKEGEGLLCPSGTFPPPLNPSSDFNKNPIPFWNTRVVLESTEYEFITWSLEISQEVVKFFACENSATVAEPKYLAVGPMTIGLTGSYMADFLGTPQFPGDTLTSATIHIGNDAFKLTDLEATTESDDVQTGETLVPLNIDYTAYGIELV